MIAHQPGNVAIAQSPSAPGRDKCLQVQRGIGDRDQSMGSVCTTLFIRDL